MAQNLIFDPVKRDYIFKDGSPQPTDRVLEASYIALKIPQGLYLYEQPGQGSLIHTLQNLKRTSSIEQQFASYAKDAIERQVIKTGQATKVQISNLATSKTGTSNEIDVTPSAVQISTEFDWVGV